MRKKTLKTEYNFHSVCVTNLIAVAEGVYVLSFRRPFTFRAGQVVALTLASLGIERLYSIASGEREEDVSILFNIMDEGMLTPKLAQLNKDDQLLVSDPIGCFVDEGKPAFWIATGTGVAPFSSMLKSDLGMDNTLIHGARKISDFYFAELFSATFGEKYVRCCSQESSEGVFSGRLTEYLKSFDHFPAGCKFYLCGSAGMVVQVRDILISKLVPFEDIIAEIYF